MIYDIFFKVSVVGTAINCRIQEIRIKIPILQHALQGPELSVTLSIYIKICDLHEKCIKRCEEESGFI